MICLQPGLTLLLQFICFAMLVSVVKEVAMASMTPPSPSPPFASSSLRLSPSSPFPLCSRGSQPNLCLGRRGSPINPCFSTALQNGKPCYLQSESRKDSALRRFSCRASSSSEHEPELPEKLQEIVRLFQGVTEPRAKCERLLQYAAKLKPFAEDRKQPENKVEGCVSKVYIACEFNAEDGRVYFEAESDVMLTKGLAGLLVEGLSGVTVEEVLKVTPDFVHMLGLKQSLTPSRSNGFLNMLKLIQTKTLQVYSNSVPSMVAARNATVPITSINSHDSLSDHSPSPESPQTKKHPIEKKLEVN